MDARIVSVLVSQWRRVATLVAVIAGGCLVLAVQDASADGVPIKVRFGGDAGSTRVVLDVAQQVDGRVVGSDSGRQLVLEFPRLSVDRASGQGQGLVKDWALERSGAGARLTLNLAQTGQVERRFSLAPSDGVAFYRYVVDVRSALAAAAPQPAPAPVAQPVVARAAAAAAAPATAPARPSAVRRENARKVIVIDAGHGGHDSGALGDHHQEKEITLAAARALKARLERTGRYKVVLTRSDDTFIPLEERAPPTPICSSRCTPIPGRAPALAAQASIPYRTRARTGWPATPVRTATGRSTPVRPGPTRRCGKFSLT